MPWHRGWSPEHTPLANMRVLRTPRVCSRTSWRRGPVADIHGNVCATRDAHIPINTPMESPFEP